MQQFLVTGVGAMVTGPVDPAAQAPVIRQAFKNGVDAGTLVFGPGTDQVNASQYAVGKTLADLAANYIKTKLGGKATAGARERGQHEIDLLSTSNVFLRGHRLRLHVTSSSFPRWDRNLNTGNQCESRHQVAHQRIYHDADRPSYIELSVNR